MITGSITERRDIPHEDGEWMALRLLGWQQLEEARDARARRGLQHIKAMGTEVYAAIQTATAQQATNGAGPAPQDRDIEDTYDKATLLRLGIAGWSYPEPVTPETIGQLDEVTAKWAMGAILGVLFMRSAADRGKRHRALHAYLDGQEGAAPPREWTIGMICDAFGCTPSQAVNEPYALCLEIIDQRAYARAYAAVEQAKTPADLPNDPLIHEVRANQVVLQAEALMRWGQEID